MTVGRFLRRLAVTAAVATVAGGASIAMARPRPAGAAVVSVTCANATSDTALLNNAISGSAVGDEVHVHGSCLVNGTVKLKGARSYLGDSRTGTVIRQANGSNLAAVVASDGWFNDTTTTDNPVRIAHLTIDGNSPSNTGTTDLVIRSWLTVAEDLYLLDAPADGLAIVNASRNGTALTNTEVNGRISNVFVESPGAAGVHVIDAGNAVTDWTLADSWVGHAGATAVDMDNAAGWQIRNVHTYSTGHHAIDARRCYGTTIESNYIEDFGDAGGATNTWYGISCTLQGDKGSTVTDNRVFQGYNPASASIFIGLSGNYGAPRAAITGNVVRGNSQTRETGLSYTKNSATSIALTSSGNNVTDVGTVSTVGAGVSVTAGV